MRKSIVVVFSILAFVTYLDHVQSACRAADGNATGICTSQSGKFFFTKKFALYSDLIILFFFTIEGLGDDCGVASTCTNPYMRCSSNNLGRFCSCKDSGFANR